MTRAKFQSILAAAAAVLGLASPAFAADTQVERGRYLVAITGCGDCHTPGHFLGHPDASRLLGGSDVGFAVPGLGVFLGPNLTPDKATGLGAWSPDQIATAITQGRRPDGRMLAPPMPVAGLSHLTGPDALAIAAYLKSLPPVSRKVPGPFGPDEKPDAFVMTVLPGDAYAALPRPPAK